MATRYWVGGTGTWNPSNTANWSATSGGAGGASVPTASDDVIFNSSSGGGTITIAGSPLSTVPCLSFNSSGFTGTFTAASYMYIYVYAGNVTLGGTFIPDKVGINHAPAASGSYTANLGSKRLYYSFAGDNTGANLTISGINMSGATDGYSAVAIQTTNVVTCTDANISSGNAFLIDSCNTVNFGSGTVTCAYIVIIRNTVVSGSRTANLVGIPTGPYVGQAITNLQGGNCGIDVVNVNSASSCSFNVYSGAHPSIYVYACSGPIYLSRPGSFGTVEVSSGTEVNCDDSVTIGALVVNGPTQVTFQSSSTVNYLATASTVTNIILNADITISTMSITGPSGTTSVRSNTAGTQRTLTSSSYSLSNITWKDIYAAGNIPFTGSGFVDGGNTTNILYGNRNGLFLGSNF